MNSLFQMQQLSIASQQKVLVQDATFQLFAAEFVALTGPSGSGKSLVADAMVGLLDPALTIAKGEMFYFNKPIMQYNTKQWRMLRQQEIALLIQHSLHGLDPIRKVKAHFWDTLRTTIAKKELENFVTPILQQVGFPQPERILNSYPFELSGGMQQRVLLALMLVQRPKILIADEPTTALDRINTKKVLQLLKELQQHYQLTVLLISHDEESIKWYADRIIRMEQGVILS